MMQMLTRFRVQAAGSKELLFTCATMEMARTMAAGTAVATRIVTVKVPEYAGY